MKKKKMKQHIKDIWADISLFAQRFDTVHQELQETRQALADLRASHEFLTDDVQQLMIKLAQVETELHTLKLQSNAASTALVPDLSNLSKPLPKLQEEEVETK